MAFDTFDTDSIITGGITFSGGNLVAQATTGSLAASRIAQSIEGKKSGKWYVEFTCGGVSGNIDGVGVVNSIGIGGIGFIGGGRPIGYAHDISFGYYTNDHATSNNSTISHVNGATWTTGDVICVAVDLDNGKIWLRKNTGSWMGPSGTPDPATNTDGYDISDLLLNNCRVYPAANLSGNGAKFTANFGGSAFTGSVPSGFTSGWTNTVTASFLGTLATNGFGQETQTPPQNNLAVSKYTSNFNGTLDHVVASFCMTATDQKCVVYDATGTGGLPGALLGVSSVVNGGIGEVSFTNFSPAVTLVSGTAYYIGFVSDAVTTTANQTETGGTSAAGIWFKAGNYTTPDNPFPSSPSTVNFRYPLLMFKANVTTTLTAAEGTYALSGKTALFSTGRRVTATQGSYVISGQTTTSHKSLSVLATRGLYALTGFATLSELVFGLLADFGVYHLDGQDVLQGHNRTLKAKRGRYKVKKQKTVLHLNQGSVTIWPVEDGDYELTGQDVVFGQPIYTLTFAALNNPALIDWAMESGASYASYLDTNFVVPGDPMSFANVPYLYVFVEDGDSENDVGLLMAVAKNWATDLNAPELGRETQVYRFRDGYALSLTKNRIRGKGRVFQMRFRSDAEKDFNLRGWAGAIEKNLKV